MTKYQPRHQNESLILEKIINSNEISRSELAKVTKITKSSISDIIKTLLDQDLVFEDNHGSSSHSGGRRPVNLKFNGKSALVIGIDIGRDYIHSCLSTIDGNIIEDRLEESLEIDKNNIIEKLEYIIQSFLNTPTTATYGIIGIGIAIHGTIFENRVTFTPYSNLEDLDIVDLLSENIELPIYLINEANASALGEYAYSSHSENLININIKDGIGAGIIEEGYLYIGKNGSAGEIGHTTLYPDGILCPCGNMGCLEQYAASSPLYRSLKASLKSDFVTTDEIASLWNQGHKDVQTLLIENAKLISIGINNIASMYDPEIVIINNELYRKIPELLNIVEKELHGRTTQKLSIKNTRLDNNSILYGCISLITQKFLKINKIKFTNR